MIQASLPAFAQGRCIAAALFACLLAACSPAPESTIAKPAMWLVEDEDTKLYLLGTMHALPPGTDWDEGEVAKAIAEARELILELSPRQLAEAGAEFQRLAPRNVPLAIDKRLPPTALTAYRAFEASGSGKSFGADALDDWAVMVVMGQRAAQNARLSPAEGVETGLTARFKATGKPIAGLETAREQLMLFETLDPATQRTMLTNAAAGADSAVAKIEALTAAWSRGDVNRLEAMINEDIDAVPAARSAIITERNRRWAIWAKKRMGQPGTVLIAVGTGHLVGADGVPKMLEAEGLKVTRVQ